MVFFRWDTARADDRQVINGRVLNGDQFIWDAMCCSFIFMFRLWLLLCVSKSFQSESTTMRYHRSDCHTFNSETLYCMFVIFFWQVFGIRRSVLFCDEFTTIYSILYEYDRVFKYCAGEWIQSKWMNEELKAKKKPRRLTYTYESMCTVHISNLN